MTKDERLWTKAEVAEYLGVTTRTVERLRIPRVQLPGTKRRPIVRFRPDQVKAWADLYATRRPA